MNILALSDCPPNYSIIQMVDNYRPDLILTLGDFSIQSLKELSSVNTIPKLGVYGNHCTRGYMEELEIVNMHLKTINIGGLIFGGFEGCVRYKDSPFEPMFTQQECSQMMLGLPKVDIFLSHCPPWGINDDQSNPNDISHSGFIGLRDYLDKNSPKAWFHGHTYPTSPVQEYSETAIYYIDGEGLVSLGELGVKKVNLI